MMNSSQSVEARQLPERARRRASLESDFAAPTPDRVPVVEKKERSVTPTFVEELPEDDPVVSSNVHLPEEIAQHLAEVGRRRNLTNGEMVIEALESTYGRLSEFVHPGGKVGGTLFKARGVGSTVKQKADTKQVAFSLLRSDFEVIDRIKEELAARSRSHLLTAAFQAYFQPTAIEKD